MNLHTHTPTVVAVDSRGLPVRHIDYCRNEPHAHAFPHLTRQAFDAAGRKLSSTDPRLDLPGSRVVHDLAGDPLLTDSVDAGWQLSLRGQAGQLLETWDSRNSRSCLQYDELLRVTAIVEQLQGQPWQVVERLDYGDASEQSVSDNQCGQLSRRDDPAGCTFFLSYAVTGVALIQERRFLTALDTPDWPEAVLQRDSLLEAEGYRSVINIGALGDVITRNDAQGHLQFMRHTCAGQLKSIGLKLAGHDTSQTLVSGIDYNASGAVEREIAGNGVVSRIVHDEESGRLSRLLAQTAHGQTLQDLIYTYDPVGNVLSIEDAAQPRSFFRNQRTDPVNRYVYDSLYQLTEATGREVASFSHGPALPGVQPAPMDPACLVNYIQRFVYDAGSNLLMRHHSGAETWRMAVSAHSNRSLPQRADGSLPDEHEIAEAFDSNGNLKMLQPSQSMTWDARNQLSEITSVKRDDGPDDCELYRYDGGGMRVRKVRFSQMRNRRLNCEVRYLPGLEIHRNDATREVRHVLTVPAGRCSIRLLHWDSGKPEGVDNDQRRYSLADHLGSSTLELDDEAKLISHEGYYPFGGTAWWAARSALEAKYKTVRYSGKERDATGLYYYGFRYYAPWLQRWVNPDPAGDVDGLNRYCMVANNPIGFSDEQGLEIQTATRWRAAARRARSAINVRTVASGIIAVQVRGSNEVFGRIGISLDRKVTGDRNLSYLSISSDYKGKVSGGEQPLNPKTMTASEFEGVTGKQRPYAAFINGGFFNLKRRLDLGYPVHASVGANRIDGRKKDSVPTPLLHREDYVKVEMNDKSYIHSGPQLTNAGAVSFTEETVKRKSRFRFSKQTNIPGYLGHADQPNPRSAISQPASGEGRTRLAIGLTDSRDEGSPGYTLPEWAVVMSRLDRLDHLDMKGQLTRSVSGSSVNLDGGGSSMLAVFDQQQSTLFYMAGPDDGREVGNFLSFHQKKPGWWARFSR